MNIYKNIFRLYIAVHDVVIMQALHSQAYLREVEKRLLLVHLFDLLCLGCLRLRSAAGRTIHRLSSTPAQRSGRFMIRMRTTSSR
jgi:hypothetical protein